MFSCLLDVFSLCCVCFLDMCARTPVKYYPGTTPKYYSGTTSKCYSKILLRYYYKVQMTCALNFVPFSLLVCFHAFWMCFPFVVCVFGYVCTYSSKILPRYYSKILLRYYFKILLQNTTPVLLQSADDNR